MTQEAVLTGTGENHNTHHDYDDTRNKVFYTHIITAEFLVEAKGSVSLCL